MRLISRSILLKLLKKALLYRLMANIDSLINEAKLNHRELSSRTGRSENWFNDAYNNNEDIYISSFTKVLAVIQQELDLNSYHLNDIFDNKILEISTLICSLSDLDDGNSEYINDLILTEKTLFIDILGDWASLDYRKKLSELEISVMSQVKKLIQ